MLDLNVLGLFELKVKKNNMTPGKYIVLCFLCDFSLKQL